MDDDLHRPLWMKGNINAVWPHHERHEKIHRDMDICKGGAVRPCDAAGCEEEDRERA